MVYNTSTWTGLARKNTQLVLVFPDEEKEAAENRRRAAWQSEMKYRLATNGTAHLRRNQEAVK